MSEPSEPTGAAPALRELTGRIGKYEIVRLIGKGAMGMVYLAHDTVLDRDVALKVMAAQIADDLELKGRFEREARAVAKMAHPNIVTIFDLGSHTDGSPYIAMELLRGQDLQRLVKRQGDIPFERKIMIMLQVLSGLAHAHAAGIVHRDIKPANIFIAVDNSVKIMDFGVARLTTASMTGTGNIVGTADYMSPEQVKGQKVDGRSDLFSVGCMIYELIAGKRPFHADNLMAIFYRITHQEADFDALPPTPQVQALLPILRKAIAKDIDARYQTARDFAADLRELLRSVSPADAAVITEMEGEVATTIPPQPSAATQRGGLPVDATVEIGPTVVAPSDGGLRPPPAPRGTAQRAAPPVRAPRPVPPAAGRRSPVGALVGAGALVLVAGLGVAWWLMLRQPPAPDASPTQSPTAAAGSTAVVAPTAVVEATAVPVATPEPTPLPTAAPQPTFAPPEGKAAEQVRAAQAAFRRSDYDRSVLAAQQALRDDPMNTQARQLLDNALAGQRAVGRFRAAQASLGKGDLDLAAREVAEARQLAPWDARGPELLKQIEQAQQQAAQAARRKADAEQTARVAALLDKADDAMRARSFEQAIRLYDEVLRQDPGNARAGQGKTGAIAAQAMAQSASASSSQRVAASVKGFQAGKTAAQAGDGGARSVPEGFEAGGEVVARRGAQAADLPGKILFDVAPSVVRAGDRYTVSVSLLNEGSGPIEVAGMQVTTTINGGKSGGSVPSLTKLVGPRRKELVFTVGDVWREDFTSWAMEVSIRTPRGEIYRNRVEWR
jgi:eukaryotic-like serine/threonine-protein kinase